MRHTRRYLVTRAIVRGVFWMAAATAVCVFVSLGG